MTMIMSVVVVLVVVVVDVVDVVDDDYHGVHYQWRWLWCLLLSTTIMKLLVDDDARDVVNHDDNKVCFDDNCCSSWWQWLWAAQHHRHISADQLLLLEAQHVSSRRSVLKFKINVGFWSKEHCIVSCRSSGILAPLSSKLLGCEVFPLLSLTWALNNRLNQG